MSKKRIQLRDIRDRLRDMVGMELGEIVETVEGILDDIEADLADYPDRAYENANSAYAKPKTTHHHVKYDTSEYEHAHALDDNGEDHEHEEDK